MNKSFANSIGLDVADDINSNQLEQLLSDEITRYQKDYETSFQTAYGKKELKSLANAYVQKQQQSVANIELALNVGSMAMMIVPGGVAATSGWLLKGATGLRTVKALQTINTVAKTAQGVQQAVSLPLMAQMTLRPTELWEQLSSENGMSSSEWEAWGQGVLQNTVYMAAGMGASKLAEAGAAYYKTRALVSTLKEAGKTADEISAIVKSNPVKFPDDVVKSLNRVDNLAKTLQISSEVALDLTSTIAVNKMMNNGDLLPQDVIMSIGFALSGGVFQKQFMPLTTDAKVKFLQDAFRDVELSREDALNILKTMDDISAGKISIDDAIGRSTVHPNDQVNTITRPNEELPMMNYALRTPSEVAHLRKLFKETLSPEELEILVKLPPEEEEAIGMLMFGPGLSFEDARYHYALPKEMQEKANLVLNHISLEQIPNYQEFVAKLQEMTEDEIYSVADLACWTKNCKDATPCIEVVKSCNGDSAKINKMKQISCLSYDQQTLFTANDMLKILNSGADLDSVLKFFERGKGYGREGTYNLDKVTYKTQEQISGLACLLNEHNIYPLMDFCYSRRDKLDIDLLINIATASKDEVSSNNIHRGIYHLGADSTEEIVRLLNDYDKNPEVTSGLIDISVYRDREYSKLLDYNDEFTLNYIPKINTYRNSKTIVQNHVTFLENIKKYPEETQEWLKKLYLEDEYAKEDLITMTLLDDPTALSVYSAKECADILDVLFDMTQSMPDIQPQNLFNTILESQLAGMSSYMMRANTSQNSYPVLAKMLEKRGDGEVFDSEFILEILKTIREYNIKVDSDIVDKVLDVVQQSPDMLLEFPTIARMFSEENSEFFKTLDMNTDVDNSISIASLYAETFANYSSEAQKFGCSTLPELENYFAQTKTDKIEVGKLIGRIKKEALENFKTSFPAHLQSLIKGETGEFTAKDFEQLISRLNNKPVLKSMLNTIAECDGKVSESVLSATAIMMLDTTLERSMWSAFENSDLNFRQEFALSKKIYDDILVPKIKDMTTEMPKADAEDFLASLNDYDCTQSIYRLLLNARTMLPEGMLKGLMYNNSPAKSLEILNSLAEINNPQECSMWKEMFAAKGLKDNEIQQLVSMVGNIDVDLLKEFKQKFLKADKLDVAGLVNECFNMIKANAGIVCSKGADISGWDLRYVPHILKAQSTLSEDNVLLLNKILESTFEGKYKDFLFDESLPNGKLNTETKRIFAEEDLNFEAWMNYDKVHKFNFNPTNQEGNLSSIVKSLESDILLMLKNEKLSPLVKECLEKTGFTINGTTLMSNSGGILGVPEVSSLVEELIGFSKLHGRELRDASLLDLTDHFASRRKGLKQVASSGGSEELSISLWKRDPKHDLFQGHYCGCCIALDGMNSLAIVHSLSHVVDNTVELKNSSGETIGKAKVLWMHDNKTNEPIFLVNGFEITAGKEYNKQVRDAFLTFFKDYSKAVAGKEVKIVTADCSYQKINIADLESYSTEVKMMGAFPKEGMSSTYHLDTFQKTEGSWPRNLEKPKDLTIKVMYDPADLKAQIIENSKVISNVLDASGIKYDSSLFANIPKDAKDIEILADNVRILLDNINDLPNPKDKEKEIQYALLALFDSEMNTKIRAFADNIHNSADSVSPSLSKDVTSLFNDTNSPVSVVVNDKGVYYGVYSNDITEVGRTHSRAKSADSVYSKIMNEVIGLAHSKFDEVAFNADVRDAFGFRVISPDNTLKPISEIAQSSAQTYKDVFYSYKNDIELEDALKDFYETGFNGKIWQKMFPEQRDAVLNIAIENKSQPFVAQLLSLINDGKIAVEKISNYVTAFEEKIPYLTARQQMLISDAMSAITGKPAVNYYKKPYSTRGSGYTAAQMNIKVTGYDTNIELQYRDSGINVFAEKEHVPYDISENKITVRGEKYEPARKVLKNLADDGKKLYAKYRSDVYTYYRLIALCV